MKVACAISFAVCSALLALFCCRWFDIVQLNDTIHGILSIVALLSLLVFIRTYIRLRKSTRRYR